MKNETNTTPATSAPAAEAPAADSTPAAAPAASKPAKGKAKPAAEEEPKLGKLGGYLGHTVVSVIRLLGSMGWNYKSTRAAFDRVGCKAADQTIRIQLKVGRDGHGALAEMSKKDLATLGKPLKAEAAKADSKADTKGKKKGKGKGKAAAAPAADNTTPIPAPAAELEAAA